MDSSKSLLGLVLWIVFAVGIPEALGDEDSALIPATAPAPDSSRPSLSVGHSASNLFITWPRSAADWIIERAASLDAPVWTVESGGFQTNASNFVLNVTQGDANMFYRLRSLSADHGITGEWQLNEGEGDSGGSSGGAGAALRLQNTQWGPGRVGAGSLHFNGLPWAGIGSRVSVSNENFQVLPPSGLPFSLSMWFSPDALALGARALAGNDGTGTNGWKLLLHPTGPGTNHLIFSGGTAPDSLSVTGRSLLLPGQWYRLAVTYDGSDGRIYLNGNLLGRSSGNVAMHNGPVYFGGGIAPYSSFFGQIDEIRLYTNCLGADAISLNGDWRFNEDNGTIAADSSLQKRHGQLSTAPSLAPGKHGSGADVRNGPVRISNDDLTILPESGSPFSVSMWIYPRSLPTGRIGLMSCTDQAEGGWELAIISESSGETTFAMTSTNWGGTLDFHAPANLSSSNWSKVDLTFNGGIATLYCNGVRVGSDSGAIRACTQPLLIGTASDALSFDGVIDELKIYSRERGASEIGPVAETMWETVFLNSSTNLQLKGSGPLGRTLTYDIVESPALTNGIVTQLGDSDTVTYAAGDRKGPDAFAYTVSDGEFTSAPALVIWSVVQPRWLSPSGGGLEPNDGSSPEQAWKAGAAAELDAIWRTNNYYDCFFYAPGTYETTGWKFLERGTAHPGCKHMGAGSEPPLMTTIKMVNIWASTEEGLIFAPLNWDHYSDGFELHDMVLDCNAANTPKYQLGEQIWLRVPLVRTGIVDSVTIRWADTMLGGWRAGRARQFQVCARVPTAEGYVTNCFPRSSTGAVDVITVNSAADEVLIQLNQRGTNVQFYAISELEIAGPEVSLPKAKIVNGGPSQLNPLSATYNILHAVDGDSSTAWASGLEEQVEITLPFPSGSKLTGINLRWNCGMIGGKRVGAASNFVIRARNPVTQLFEDIPLVRQAPNVDGLEAVTFGTAENLQSVTTDQLSLVLISKEPGVDYYSLLEVGCHYHYAAVRFRVPSSTSTLGWGGDYSMLGAFDGASGSAWTCNTQGQIAGIHCSGSNMKFKGLKVIRFGTFGMSECFPIYVFPPAYAPPMGNVTIEDCKVLDPTPNNADGLTAIVLSGHGTKMTNAVVRRCSVEGVRAHFIYSHAFSASQVEDCYARDCEKGVYFEPEPGGAEDVGSVLVRSNRFENVHSGIYLFSRPAAKFRSLTCIGNEVIMAPSGGVAFGSCDVCWDGPSGIMTNMVLLNNIARFADWGTRSFGIESGIWYSDIRHAVFANNIIALGTINPLRVRQCPSGYIPPPDPSKCDPNPPPGQGSAPPCLDVLRPGYRRFWSNNRDLNGQLLEVRFRNVGFDGLASQQQWPR